MSWGFDLCVPLLPDYLIRVSYSFPSSLTSHLHKVVKRGRCTTGCMGYLSCPLFGWSEQAKIPQLIFEHQDT